MKYHVILWRKPTPEKSFDSLCVDAFQTLSVFTELGRSSSPNYLTAWRKSDALAHEFEWTLEHFREVLLSNPINKGNSQLGELGYSMSFFSSPDEQISLGFSLKIGNLNPLFLDTLVVTIPDSNTEAMNDLFQTFQQCAKLFHPYWGCVTEADLIVSHMPKSDRPTSVLWLNYWSDELLQLIGPDIVKSAFGALGIQFSQGFFQIQDSPISPSSEDDMLRFKNINSQLRTYGVLSV